MLNIINFDYKEILTATDLNTIDTNIEDAIRDLGIVVAEMDEDWVVKQDLRKSLDKLYISDESATPIFYEDYTNPARSSLITPYFPTGIDWNWGVNDYMYYGFNNKWYGLYFHFSIVSTADLSTSPAWSWQYWNGTAWTVYALLSDGTTGWTTNGNITWSTLANWTPVSLNVANGSTMAEYEERYWVRMVPAKANAEVVRIDTCTRDVYRTDELEVQATNPATMYIIVRPGIACIDGTLAIVPNETGLSIKSPSTAGHSWYAAVQLTKDGEIVIDYGDSSAGTPIKKNCRVNAIKLADIEVDYGDTQILTGDITDQRIYDYT